MVPHRTLLEFTPRKNHGGLPMFRIPPAMFAAASILALNTTQAWATSHYEYGADEYVTIARGISPDGKLAITTHGEGDLGYGNFHVYLTDAATGRKIGAMGEIADTLDTGAGAFCASWSGGSRQVAIIYRISRHAPLKVVVYGIVEGRAVLLRGPVDATEDQGAYWTSQCSVSKPSEKIFGVPRKN